MNNTLFRAGPMTKDNCKLDADWTEAKCLSHKGGAYNRDKSRTWLAQEFRGASYDPNAIPFDPGEDVFGAEGVINFAEFPISLKKGFTGEPMDHGLIGLATNSTLLNALVDAGKVPSRTWSLDYGWTGDPSIDPESWVDGSLTLGGYDESRFTGMPYHEDFAMQGELGEVDSECTLKVTIVSIALQNSTGPGSVELMSEGKSDARL